MGYRRTPDIKLPSDPGELGYLAGLIDGEGHVAVFRAFDKTKSVNVSHVVRVVITNCDKGVMEYLISLSGVPAHRKSIPLDKKGVWKEGWNWQLTGRNAETFLRAILPWLKIKREQAELLLQLRDLGKHAWKGRSGLDPEIVRQREEITLRVFELNKRGYQGEIETLR